MRLPPRVGAAAAAAPWLATGSPLPILHTLHAHDSPDSRPLTLRPPPPPLPPLLHPLPHAPSAGGTGSADGETEGDPAAGAASAILAALLPLLHAAAPDHLPAAAASVTAALSALPPGVLLVRDGLAAHAVTVLSSLVVAHPSPAALDAAVALARAAPSTDTLLCAISLALDTPAALSDSQLDAVRTGAATASRELVATSYLPRYPLPGACTLPGPSSSALLASGASANFVLLPSGELLTLCKVSSVTLTSQQLDLPDEAHPPSSIAVLCDDTVLIVACGSEVMLAFVLNPRAPAEHLPHLSHLLTELIPCPNAALTIAALVHPKAPPTLLVATTATFARGTSSVLHTVAIADALSDRATASLTSRTAVALPPGSSLLDSPSPALAFALTPPPHRDLLALDTASGDMLGPALRPTFPSPAPLWLVWHHVLPLADPETTAALAGHLVTLAPHFPGPVAALYAANWHALVPEPADQAAALGKVLAALAVGPASSVAPLPPMVAGCARALLATSSALQSLTPATVLRILITALPRSGIIAPAFAAVVLAVLPRALTSPDLDAVGRVLEFASLLHDSLLPDMALTVINHTATALSALLVSPALSHACTVFAPMLAVPALRAGVASSPTHIPLLPHGFAAELRTLLASASQASIILASPHLTLALHASWHLAGRPTSPSLAFARSVANLVRAIHYADRPTRHAARTLCTLVPQHWQAPDLPVSPTILLDVVAGLGPHPSDADLDTLRAAATVLSDHAHFCCELAPLLATEIDSLPLSLARPLLRALPCVAAVVIDALVVRLDSSLSDVDASLVAHLVDVCHDPLGPELLHWLLGLALAPRLTHVLLWPTLRALARESAPALTTLVDNVVCGLTAATCLVLIAIASPLARRVVLDALPAAASRELLDSAATDVAPEEADVIVSALLSLAFHDTNLVSFAADALFDDSRWSAPMIPSRLRTFQWCISPSAPPESRTAFTAAAVRALGGASASAVFTGLMPPPPRDAALLAPGSPLTTKIRGVAVHGVSLGFVATASLGTDTIALLTDDGDVVHVQHALTSVLSAHRPAQLDGLDHELLTALAAALALSPLVVGGDPDGVAALVAVTTWLVPRHVAASPLAIEQLARLAALPSPLLREVPHSELVGALDELATARHLPGGLSVKISLGSRRFVANEVAGLEADARSAGLTRDHLERGWARFRELDTDNDGLLDVTDFAAAGLPVSSPLFASYIAACRRPDSGRIDVLSFLRASILATATPPPTKSSSSRSDDDGLRTFFLSAIAACPDGLPSVDADGVGVILDVGSLITGPCEITGSLLADDPSASLGSSPSTATLQQALVSKRTVWLLPVAAMAQEPATTDCSVPSFWLAPLASDEATIAELAVQAAAAAHRPLGLILSSPDASPHHALGGDMPLIVVAKADHAQLLAFSTGLSATGQHSIPAVLEPRAVPEQAISELSSREYDSLAALSSNHSHGQLRDVTANATADLHAPMASLDATGRAAAVLRFALGVQRARTGLVSTLNELAAAVARGAIATTDAHDLVVPVLDLLLAVADVEGQHSWAGELPPMTAALGRLAEHVPRLRSSLLNLALTRAAAWFDAATSVRTPRASRSSLPGATVVPGADVSTSEPLWLPAGGSHGNAISSIGFGADCDACRVEVLDGTHQVTIGIAHDVGAVSQAATDQDPTFVVEMTCDDVVHVGVVHRAESLTELGIANQPDTTVVAVAHNGRLVAHALVASLSSQSHRVSVSLESGSTACRLTPLDVWKHSVSASPVLRTPLSSLASTSTHRDGEVAGWLITFRDQPGAGVVAGAVFASRSAREAYARFEGTPGAMGSFVVPHADPWLRMNDAAQTAVCAVGLRPDELSLDAAWLSQPSLHLLLGALDCAATRFELARQPQLAATVSRWLWASVAVAYRLAPLAGRAICALAADGWKELASEIEAIALSPWDVDQTGHLPPLMGKPSKAGIFTEAALWTTAVGSGSPNEVAFPLLALQTLMAYGYDEAEPQDAFTDWAARVSALVHGGEGEREVGGAAEAVVPLAVTGLGASATVSYGLVDPSASLVATLPPELEEVTEVSVVYCGPPRGGEAASVELYVLEHDEQTSPSEAFASAVLSGLPPTAVVSFTSSTVVKVATRGSLLVAMADAPVTLALRGSMRGGLEATLPDAATFGLQWCVSAALSLSTLDARPSALGSMVSALRGLVHPQVRRVFADEELARTAGEVKTGAPAPVETIELDVGLSGGGDAAALVASQLTAHVTARSAAELRTQSRPWKVAFRGLPAADAGGPFREALSLFATGLRAIVLEPSPNQALNVGESRSDWVFVSGEPSVSQKQMLRALGMLMGYCVRSPGLLELDLPLRVWRALTYSREAGGVGVLAAQDSLVAMSLAANHGDDVSAADAAANALLAATSAAEAAVRDGLEAIVPPSVLRIMLPDELELAVSGHRELDLEQLREAALVVAPLDETSPEVEYTWQALTSFDADLRAAFVQFVWGRRRLSPCEMAEKHLTLRRLVVPPGTEPDTVLPQASTCWFMLYLPPWSSYEVARERLAYALVECRAMGRE
ncbi:ubiquitin-protein ligase 1 [Thecamonas trahens ATCC 50062]|uniref:Ubiquitin-protein ligase 1 n=1 Tax=Thecamonas trahens ATCC 50062 TaxID=461836 RepID=A0A0L0D4N1_THETB|nr:ubiquitin-protein ligase 1 [Thecamonas trahens ATCC 50062]KNC47317.1 ubiquitin-protein ligase 1 [Thecamonas trahens ATCC 50062]|eukprot:XP_013759655.1 ubiquitin-protein ligase 1 [Thecamonas trahens ATCC 50062]